MSNGILPYEDIAYWHTRDNYPLILSQAGKSYRLRYAEHPDDFSSVAKIAGALGARAHKLEPVPPDFWDQHKILETVKQNDPAIIAVKKSPFFQKLETDLSDLENHEFSQLFCDAVCKVTWNDTPAFEISIHKKAASFPEAVIENRPRIIIGIGNDQVLVACRNDDICGITLTLPLPPDWQTAPLNLASQNAIKVVLARVKDEVKEQGLLPKSGNGLTRLLHRVDNSHKKKYDN